MKRVLIVAVMAVVLVGSAGCALLDRMGARALAEKFWDEWTAGATDMETLNSAVVYRFNGTTTGYGPAAVESNLQAWSNLNGFQILDVEELSSKIYALPDPDAAVVFHFTSGMAADMAGEFWCTLRMIRDPWRVTEVNITTSNPLL